MIGAYKLTGSLLAAAAIAGCSSGGEPTPTMAGTWHVTIHTLTSGAITPSSFDVVIAPSGATYAVSMPELTWTGGPSGVPVVFNAPPAMVRYSADSLTGFGEEAFGLQAVGLCGEVSFGGTLNASKDSLHNAVIGVADTMVALGSSFACYRRWTGTFTAVKTSGGGSLPPAPPAPVAAGAWHVIVGAANQGTVAPDTFDATLVAQADTLAATLPSMTWTSGGVTAYDTLPFAAVVADTLTLGQYRHSRPNACQYVFYTGLIRADTAEGTMFVADTNLGAAPPVCVVRSYAPFRATK